MLKLTFSFTYFDYDIYLASIYMEPLKNIGLVCAKF